MTSLKLCKNQHQKIGSLLLILVLSLLVLPQSIGGERLISSEKCRSNVCFNDGQCFVSRGAGGGGHETKFFCECRSGFAGLLCEVECNLHCQNGGKCQKTGEKGEFCECPEGFRGPLCAEKLMVKVATTTTTAATTTTTTEVEDCRQSSRGCPFAHVCLLDADSGEFHCERNLCLRWGQSPCANNATCRPIKNDFICECNAGFDGRHCADDIDECQEANAGRSAETVDEHQHEHGGDGELLVLPSSSSLLRGPCQNGGKCVNLPGTFECQCPPGFEGPICQHHVGTCATSPCGLHGRCQDVDNDGAFRCHCHGNFSGTRCETECQSPRIILAPATVANASAAAADAAGGGGECVCPAGKTGEHCELENVVAPCSNSITENGANNGQQWCQNGGQCVPAGSKAFCICPTGFSGPKCEHRDLSTAAAASAMPPADETVTEPSVDEPPSSSAAAATTTPSPPAEATIVVQRNTTSATVGTKKVPKTAQSSSSSPITTDHDHHCSPNPCLNGGKCVAKENGPFCECPSGKFAGTRCQLECHCLSGEETCAESTDERDQVECFRLPNNSSNIQTQPEHLKQQLTIPAVTDEQQQQQQQSASSTTVPPNLATVSSGTMPGRHTVVAAKQHSVDGPSSVAAGAEDDYDQDKTADQQDPDQEEDEEDHFGTLFGWTNHNNNNNNNNYNNNETTVSNCSECANGAKCVRIGQQQHRARCLCCADFAGALCDIKKPLCAALKCHGPGELCQPIRGQPGKRDEVRCECPPGMGGKRCSRPNTMGFTNGSVVLLQSVVRHRSKESYSLTLGIRTTLQSAHLASGENALGQTEYTMLLIDGTVHLQIGANGTEQFIGTEVPIRVNDDDWYQLKLWSTGTHGTVIELWHPETGYLLVHHLISSGHKLSQVLTTRIGQQRTGDDNTAPPFVGCMRAMALNGAESVGADDQTRAINVRPGCHRQQQCAESVSAFSVLPRDNATLPATAQSPSRCANGGVCVDLWDHFVCRCPRPFLAPRCADQPAEATFGHGHQQSNCIYALSIDDKHVVAEKTHISFLLRTGDHRFGPPFPAPPAKMPLFYIGEILGGAAVVDPETSTFIAAHLRNGVPQVNARLGGKQIYSIELQARLDDGKVHLLELSRDGNLIKMKVDEGKWHSVQIARSFEHPLLADQLIVGSVVPSSTNHFPIGAFGGHGNANESASSADQHQFFKGTLQDFRVNDRLVPFFQFDEQQQSSLVVPQFGHKLSDQNLLQGTVSDDVCATMAAQKPCGAHGTCVNMFNNFKCSCTMGWMGRRCEQHNFCWSNNGTTPICPEGTECQNLDGAFVCVSTASLFTSSSLRYTIHQFNRQQSVVDKRSKIGNLSFEIRTRTPNGHLLKLQSSDHSLILQLKNGMLHLSNVAVGAASALAHNHPIHRNITDGQWHQLVIRQNANGGNANAIALLIDGTVAQINNVISFSLAHFIMDKLARISVGRVPEQDGFKGCLRNVRAAPLPPLIFLSLQKVPRMVEAMAHAHLTHFELQHHENVVPNGCQSANVCAKNPCLNGGTCEDRWNAMRCQCAPGFEGEHCQVNRDECESQDGHAICAPNGRCVDGINGFRCACAAGFTGPMCTHAEELCRAGTCKNRAKCHTRNGTALCECGTKLIGAWCQLDAGTKCSEEPCQNGGRCFQSEHGQISCWCKPGFTGPLCELHVDPCRDQPCTNSGICVPSSQSPKALNSSSSSSRSPLFHCECAREFEGTLCERLADACARLGSRAACAGHGKCENVWGGHRCICEDGWRGRDCSLRVDACAEESPCVNGGTCVSVSNTVSAVRTAVGAFQCKCLPFYRGDRCELAGVCADNPCRNGGECVQLAGGGNVGDNNSNNSYKCRCKRNFRGTRCEQRVDVCSEQEPCQNGGTCVPRQYDSDGGDDSDDDFRCTCIPGFTGKRCEVDTDECATTNPCLHGGHCVDRVNSFECYCNGTGYMGLRCDQDIDECNGNGSNCLNGGVCTNLDGDYQCECKTGYIGKRCHMVNPCEPNPLTNRTRHNCAHGRCVRPRVRQASSGDEYVQHDCECMEGFTGELCMHLVEPQHQLALSNFIGAGVVLIVLCICLGALLYFFVICARRKRAFEGTYSPSNQELAAQSRLFNQNRQFQRQPLHCNQLSTAGNGFVHKTRRKKI